MAKNKLSRGSLQEKNGIWQAVFSKDGKTIWRSTGVKAVRGNKRKAQERLDEIRKELEEHEPEKDILFVDFIPIWLEAKKKQVREVTYLGYENRIKSAILPYFKKTKLLLADVKVHYIDNFLEYLVNEKGLKKSTVLQDKRILTSIFKEAIRRGLIENNPCQNAIVPRFEDEIDDEKKKFLTIDEIRKVLSVCVEKPIYDMIVFTFTYGLRREELMGLRWEDIDFNENVIYIRNTVTIAGRVKIEAETVKTTSSKRTYPILPQIREILERLQEEQMRNEKLLGSSYIKNNKIFRKSDGSSYSPKYPGKTLTKIEKENNLPVTSFHCLRHSCASYLISIGWSPKDVSDWLGHSDITITMNIYTHTSIDRKKEISKNIEII